MCLLQVIFFSVLFPFRLLDFHFWSFYININNNAKQRAKVFVISFMLFACLIIWFFIDVFVLFLTRRKAKKELERWTCWVNMSVGVFFATSRKPIFLLASRIIIFFCLVLKISAMHKVNSYSLQAARFPAQDVEIYSCFHLHHILPFLASGSFA